MSDYIEKKVEDLSFEHSQHNRYEPKCSECFSLNKFWEEITPEQEEIMQDAFMEEDEIGGMPIMKDNAEEMFEVWSENLSMEEITAILNPVCEYCKGTGEVSTDEMDSDGNWQRGVGTEKCECQLGDEPDFSGASEIGDR